MSREHLTEADENTLRVLAAQLRDERPDDFIALMMDVLMFRFEEDSIAGIRHKDGDGIPDAMLVVFKGTQPALWAEGALTELQRKLEKRRPPETGRG